MGEEEVTVNVGKWQKSDDKDPTLRIFLLCLSALKTLHILVGLAPLHLYLAAHLEYRLMVRHSSRPIRDYNDWQVISVLGKGSSSTSHTECFRRNLEVFLAENGIHQRDDLFLKKGGRKAT